MKSLQINKFALFLVVHNQTVENCIAYYKPGAFFTVNEQLLPSKTRYPSTQFMASKLDKYIQKYWLAVAKDSRYIVNEFLFVGKDECVSDHIVMKLAESYLKKKNKDNHQQLFYFNKADKCFKK